jgi:hypothetical protein
LAKNNPYFKVTYFEAVDSGFLKSK